MLEVIIVSLLGICFLCVISFVYRWYSLYAKIKKIALVDIFFKGYYRPKYINPNNSSFNKKQTKSLNFLLYLIFLTTGIGFVLAVFYNIINLI